MESNELARWLTAEEWKIYEYIKGLKDNGCLSSYYQSEPESYESLAACRRVMDEIASKAEKIMEPGISSDSKETIKMADDIAFTARSCIAGFPREV